MDLHVILGSGSIVIIDDIKVVPTNIVALITRHVFLSEYLIVVGLSG